MSSEDNTVAAAERRPTLPERLGIVHCDVTGTGPSDRIVAIAVIVLETAALATRDFHLRYCHLVCDPGRKSAAAAERRHRFGDWDLRHQEAFEDSADAVEALLADADLVVAHDAPATLALLQREFAALGRAPPDRPMASLEDMWRERAQGSTDLEAIAARLGLRGTNPRPGPLEDAWVILLATLWANDCNLRFPFTDFRDPAPTNWQPVPAKPPGRLPRRKRVPEVPGGE